MDLEGILVTGPDITQEQLEDHQCCQVVCLSCWIGDSVMQPSVNLQLDERCKLAVAGFAVGHVDMGGRNAARA